MVFNIQKRGENDINDMDDCGETVDTIDNLSRLVKILRKKLNNNGKMSKNI